MRVILKDRLVIMIPQSGDEARDLDAWKASHDNHVFRMQATNESALELRDLGPQAEACREPINAVSNSSDPVARLISNFAPTPFELDGRLYRSVESFWQGLKFASEDDRRRIADMAGADARAEGERKGYGSTIRYCGEEVTVGTWSHWRLMLRACRAKFAQDHDARAALLATGDRPIIHVVRRDSRTIPGAVMAGIWMRIRKELRKGVAPTTAH
jgi:predicted NAD-dependent protein-ADP-ribosyltransferase YbiA (DUF1768 family)